MDAFYLRALRSGRFSLRLDDEVGFWSDRSSDGVVSRQVEPWVDGWVAEPLLRSKLLGHWPERRSRVVELLLVEIRYLSIEIHISNTI
jgi:hypothetical protein